MFASNSRSLCRDAKRADCSETRWEWVSKNMPRKGTSLLLQSNCNQRTYPLRKSHQRQDIKAPKPSRGGLKSCFSRPPWNSGSSDKRKELQRNAFWLFPSAAPDTSFFHVLLPPGIYT